MFQTTPAAHAPAIALGMLPHIAARARTMIDGAPGAAGVTVTPDLMRGMAMGGVLYRGLEVLGAGTILVGLILAAIFTSMIDRKFDLATAFALAGAALSFFCFMDGERSGINVSPMISLDYVMVGGFLYAATRRGVLSLDEPPEPVASDAPSVQPAE